MEEVEIKNDNDYLEQMNHLQELFNKKDKEVEQVLEKYKDILKELITCYGVVRLLDNQLEEIDAPLDIKCISELLRTQLSNLFDDIKI
jgi:antitoxin component HigA of HigAB toxin-antitoxin module